MVSYRKHICIRKIYTVWLIKKKWNSTFCPKFYVKVRHIVRQFYSKVRNMQILNYIIFCLLDHVVHVTSFDCAIARNKK